MSRAARGMAAFIAVGVGGCVAGTGPSVDGSWLGADDELFATTVQPILAERCANPSCHGNDARPLSIYAVHRHRLDPAHTYRDDPLTDEELERNHASASAFLLEVGTPPESLLLQKPLAPSAGGTPHAGGVQFQDANDWGYRTIAEWAGRWTMNGGGPEP